MANVDINFTLKAGRFTGNPVYFWVSKKKFEKVEPVFCSLPLYE